MNRKILFFASRYTSNGSANGICARNLVREFTRRGHEIFVIAVPSSAKEKGVSELDGVKVWYEKQELFIRMHQYLMMHHSGFVMKLLFILFNCFRIVMAGVLYPNSSRLRSNRIKNLAVSIIETYGIDTVIGTCFPYEGIAASVYLKRMYGENLKVVTYHFDLMSIPNNSFCVFKYFKKWRFNFSFERELKYVDRVLLPETAECLYTEDKIKIVGFPVCVENNIHMTPKVEFQSDCRNIVYIGSLDKINRSPRKAIEYMIALNQVSSQRHILHVWGTLADIETRNLIESNNDLIQYHGILENTEVFSVMMKADYLLNISNTILYKLIPSKIFTMFATGKPIINIVGHQDDCTIPFFEKYGNVKRVNSYLSWQPCDFCLKMHQHPFDVKSTFVRYTPEYIADIILE